MDRVLNHQDAMSRNQSFWQFKYGPYQANAPLSRGQHDVDVVIVGGGYTGLTTARELKKDQPGLRVMVLEAHEVGFGASGRNGGFNMTLFGMEPEVTEWRWGKQRAMEAQRYMKDAVSYVKGLIEAENLDSDYEHTGMWRVAYSAAQDKRLRKTFALLETLSRPGSYQFLSQNDVRQKLNAPSICSAIYEPETGILDPCKHVRNLKVLAEKAGAEIYENTQITGLEKQGDRFLLRTSDQAEIRASKVVLATNAWMHTLPGPSKIRHRQRPVWTYQIVTEPLTQEEWQNLNWQDRMSIEDNRQLVHYMRITKCGRITMGGGNIGLEYGKQMDQWHNTRIWRDLEAHLRWLFPSLAHKKVFYQWGGAVSANIDMTPEIGFIGDQNLIYATGCLGHGVSLTQLNGRLIADLLQEKESELSQFWIVNRKAIPFPPGNLLPFVAEKAIVKLLKGMDWYEERSLVRG